MTTSPTTPPGIDARLERFDWHPEPELIGYGDAAMSRTAMEQLGERTWRAALDYLYGTATQRAMGDPSPYPEARHRYYEPSGGHPSAAPAQPMTADAVIGEFEARALVA